ncbi:hypothetical protein [Pedobacter helvus]|uniref:Uncharacterized protein n=1 Tax=Pedobacter helvus TaxID=2563444 RepID=A0ABW9JG65_9SPHI|nr:hypothetical protein [Pedobacter ureilyticus]
MTKTFTPPNQKNVSKTETNEPSNQPDQHFYGSIKQQLNKLYREPSEETITKILNYAKKR